MPFAVPDEGTGSGSFCAAWPKHNCNKINMNLAASNSQHRVFFSAVYLRCPDAAFALQNAITPLCSNYYSVWTAKVRRSKSNHFVGTRLFWAWCLQERSAVYGAFEEAHSWPRSALGLLEHINSLQESIVILNSRLIILTWLSKKRAQILSQKGYFPSKLNESLKRFFKIHFAKSKSQVLRCLYLLTDVTVPKVTFVVYGKFRPGNQATFKQRTCWSWRINIILCLHETKKTCTWIESCSSRQTNGNLRPHRTTRPYVARNMQLFAEVGLENTILNSAIGAPFSQAKGEFEYSK